MWQPRLRTAILCTFTFTFTVLTEPAFDVLLADQSLEQRAPAEIHYDGLEPIRKRLEKNYRMLTTYVPFSRQTSSGVANSVRLGTHYPCSRTPVYTTRKKTVNQC